MLIDHAKIYVKAGSGGKGCTSFYRDLFHRKGIPDGGNGGEGGSVIIISNSNLDTLLDFKYNQHYVAENGYHASSNRQAGHKGADKVVNVPVGTIIKDLETNLVIRDLSANGESVIVAEGGKGGKGNYRDNIATMGESGEERTLILELKLVADAGIIGFPNAGKSTLISRISSCHSKVAPYPFTTKSPQLGVIKYKERSLKIADMPGLIEGAHLGKGLGDRFLRHIERTRVLVHLVDMSPLDGSDPAANYFKIEKELESYSTEVSSKPRIVVAAKIDLIDSPKVITDFKRKIARKDVVAISSVSGEGLDNLIKKLFEVIPDEEKKL